MPNAAALTTSFPGDEHNPENAQGSADIHVVLVDDDALFRESLGLNLVDSGFTLSEFSNGADALDYFAQGGRADVILLDWRMPGLDGLEVLRRLREGRIEVPVIFLTVIDDEIYEEAALEGGAVDFIEKSRRLSILIKRIQLIVEGRKSAGDDEEFDAPDAAMPGQVQKWGELELDHESKRARWRGEPVGLTLTEFNIVASLAEKAGVDVSYREIYDQVHTQGFVAGTGPDGYRVNVRTFIKRIRGKFKQIDAGFDQIENYAGFGYRWRAD